MFYIVIYFFIAVIVIVVAAAVIIVAVVRFVVLRFRFVLLLDDAVRKSKLKSAFDYFMNINV